MYLNFLILYLLCHFLKNSFCINIVFYVAYNMNKRARIRFIILMLEVLVKIIFVNGLKAFPLKENGLSYVFFKFNFICNIEKF